MTRGFWVIVIVFVAGSRPFTRNSGSSANIKKGKIVIANGTSGGSSFPRGGGNSWGLWGRGLGSLLFVQKFAENYGNEEISLRRGRTSLAPPLDLPMGIWICVTRTVFPNELLKLAGRDTLTIDGAVVLWTVLSLHYRWQHEIAISVYAKFLKEDVVNNFIFFSPEQRCTCQLGKIWQRGWGLAPYVWEILDLPLNSYKNLYHGL